MRQAGNDPVSPELQTGEPTLHGKHFNLTGLTESGERSQSRIGQAVVCDEIFEANRIRDDALRISAKDKNNIVAIN